MTMAFDSGRLRPPALAARHRPREPVRWSWHDALLLLAFAGIMTSGIAFKIGSFNFAFERIYGLLLIGVLAHRLARPTFPAIRRLLWTWTAWAMILSVAALASDSFAPHLPALLIAIVPIAYFALVTEHRVDGAMMDRIVRTLLWIAGIGGVLVLLAYAVLRSDRQLLGLVDPAGRLKLTVVEPNLFGSALGFLLLLSLPRAKLNTPTVIMYALALIAFLGALSKGPIIGLVLGGILFGAFRAISRRSNLSAAIIVPIWIGILMSMLLLVVLPSISDVYDRFLARDDAITSRAYLLKLAISNIWTSPVLGRGPGDFGLQNAALLRAVGGQDNANNLWISQMMVNILHDSGILGLGIYVGFLVLLLNRGFKWVRAGSLDHCGYLAAFISLLIASQASTVHLNAIFGLAAGLVAALPRVRKDEGQVLSSGSREPQRGSARISDPWRTARSGAISSGP